MHVPETGWTWSLIRQAIRVADVEVRPALRSAVPGAAGPLWHPAADVYSMGDSWWIVLALPGVNRSGVHFEVRDGLLHIRASREAPWRKAPGSLQRVEIPYGTFERCFTLPDPSATVVAAEMIDGCLHIELAHRP